MLCMLDRAFELGADLSRLSLARERESQQPVGEHKAAFVAELRQRLDRPLGDHLSLGEVELRKAGLIPDALHTGSRRDTSFTQAVGDVTRRGQHRVGFHRMPRHAEREPEIELEADTLARVGDAQCERAFEQVRSGFEVAAGGCAVGASGEPVRGTLAQSAIRVVGLAELFAVAVGLFKVVADELVALDERVCFLIEPISETLVQFCPRRFGEGVVCGVADQQVSEAVRILSRQLRPVRAHELLPYELDQLPLGRRRRHRHRFDSAAVEELAFDRATPEHSSLGRIELIEPRRQQRLDRRRHDHLPLIRLEHHREHLLDEERVAVRGRSDPRCERRRELVAAGQPFDQLVGLDRIERLGRGGRTVEVAARPPRPAVEQLGPGEAEKQDRRVAR